jgi:uncharacterized protein
MDERYYISAESFLRDSVELADKVRKSGFKPNYLMGIWRGGTFPGIVVHEMLDYFGMKMEHYPIKTSRFKTDSKSSDDGSEKVEVHGVDEIARKLKRDDKVLIIDEVFDKGLSIQAVLERLKDQCKLEMPEVRVATIYYKPSKNLTKIIPDYFVHETNKWLVFPHEFSGYPRDELIQNKGAWLEKYLR